MSESNKSCAAEQHSSHADMAKSTTGTNYVQRASLPSNKTITCCTAATSSNAHTPTNYDKKSSMSCARTLATTTTTHSISCQRGLRVATTLHHPAPMPIHV